MLMSELAASTVIIKPVSDEQSVARVAGVIDRDRATYGLWNRHTSVEQMRQNWDDLFFLDVVPCRREDLSVNGVDMRWVVADGAIKDRVLLYLHGGGFKMGSVTSHHDLMARLSQAGHCRVLGVNYRRHPEHPFPAPLEDSLNAYRWLLAQGVKPQNIAIAGDSAGGGLAASTLLALRDAGEPLPAAAVLLSAWMDLEASAASYESRAKADPIHQKVMILALANQYLGVDGDRRNPLASPLYGDLAGLPPLLMQVGDRETGLDDSIMFADKARQAGVDVEISVWDEMIHVFQQFAEDLPEARAAIADIGVFLNSKWLAR